jgi:RimJ/RimL family protein N-acetyltransferase
VSWAQGTGEVGAVLAAVASDNTPSVRVLERVGGFIEIGTCRSEDGVTEVVYRREIPGGTERRPSRRPGVR